jgi:hypothetical protein
MRSKLVFTLTILACLFIATSLSAQATRTWVSGVGNDANPCSRTAPCKTWSGAFVKTAHCGEINAIDSGGFGTLSITKSITLNGAGVHASSLASLTTGFIVNLQQSDFCNTVILRNLSINGTSPSAFPGGSLGTTGIRIIGSVVGTNVHIEHVEIEHFQRGVDINPTTNNFKVFMKDVDIRHTGTHGIDVHPGAGNQVKLSFDRVRSEQSAGDGMRLANDVRGTISNSHFQGNNNGVNVLASSVLVSLVETVLSQNTATGLINPAAATQLLDGCTITNNNMIAGNGAGGDQPGIAVVSAAHP